MTDNEQWTPGSPVEIVANRLILRSLRPEDVPGNDAPPWYGDAERRAFIWSPPIESGQFLRGLAQACENRRFFSLLALEKVEGTAVGLSKGQVADEGGKSLFILTTLLGQAQHESLLWGYEITAATLWFAVNHLSIDEISMRVYEQNETVWQMVADSGYRLERTFEEKTPNGPLIVRDYRKTREDWLQKFGPRFGSWVVRKGASV